MIWNEYLMQFVIWQDMNLKERKNQREIEKERRYQRMNKNESRRKKRGMDEERLKKTMLRIVIHFIFLYIFHFIFNPSLPLSLSFPLLRKSISLLFIFLKLFSFFLHVDKERKLNFCTLSVRCWRNNKSLKSVKAETQKKQTCALKPLFPFVVIQLK